MTRQRQLATATGRDSIDSSDYRDRTAFDLTEETLWLSLESSRSLDSAKSVTSMPAQKKLSPFPVRIIALRFSSLSRPVKMSLRVRIISRESALNFSGRFKRMIAERITAILNDGRHKFRFFRVSSLNFVRVVVRLRHTRQNSELETRNPKLLHKLHRRGVLWVLRVVVKTAARLASVQSRQHHALQ